MRKSLLFLATVGLLFSCKKEAETPVASPSKADLLTRRPWREVGHTLTLSGSNQKAFTGGNVFDARPACWHDDFLRFERNTTLLLDEGPSTCAPGDPQQRVYTWSFRPGSDESQLIAALPHPFTAGQSNVYDITELSESTLTVRQRQSTLQGQQVEEICYSAF
ncbi:hypothetical protein [Hymenobacter yonginensis]|uniref:Lipocalin-like domain-containing protein n=1 Tax=Hymenobacter yonginensis TaxID=748197 RepID=A0ABY7PUZ5_9BACT|nr:hypothetical protein [Hymenobacter yonginensis]WBO86726.1 hypothetical protein O9Z63_20815 [Hymenobacter yonginensis]